jgi:aromatic ring-opening dioxygenase LigB subunit
MGRKIRSLKPDTIIISTPHNLRLFKRIGVVISEHSTGSLTDASGKLELSLKANCDVKFAWLLLRAAERAGLPVVGANYGSFEGPTSDLPMDWGTFVPLWFFLKEARLRSNIVIVTPSREVPLGKNLEFGRMVGTLAERDSKKRYAFIASADQAHAHSKKGPYGYSRRAAEYDRRVLSLIRTNGLPELTLFDRKFVEQSKPDSLWQMAMLAGALEAVKMEGEVLSYEVPTYYGMVCAEFTRERPSEVS